MECKRDPTSAVAQIINVVARIENQLAMHHQSNSKREESRYRLIGVTNLRRPAAEDVAQDALGGAAVAVHRGVGIAGRAAVLAVVARLGLDLLGGIHPVGGATAADVVDGGALGLALADHFLVELEDGLLRLVEHVTRTATASRDVSSGRLGEADARGRTGGVRAAGEVLGGVSLVVASTATATADEAALLRDGGVRLGDGEGARHYIDVGMCVGEVVVDRLG